MGHGYGQTDITANTGRTIQVTADGEPRWKVAGGTIDWGAVAALVAPATVNDGLTINIGQKYLRYGQVMCEITATGLYGPYDPNAADGRQNLVRNKCFIFNETLLENGVFAGRIPTGDVTNYRGMLNGGRVWIDRVIHAGAGAASLAAGPTLAALLDAMPLLEPVTANG